MALDSTSEPAQLRIGTLDASAWAQRHEIQDERRVDGASIDDATAAESR